MAHKGNLGEPVYHLDPSLHEKSDLRLGPHQPGIPPFHSPQKPSFQRVHTFLLDDRVQGQYRVQMRRAANIVRYVALGCSNEHAKLNLPP